MVSTFKNITTESPSEKGCMVFSGGSWQCDVVIYAKRTACYVSIAGCALTIFLIVFFKKHKEASQRFIAHLSLAALACALTALIKDIETEVDNICKIQGALLTLFWWQCMMFSMVIAFNLYLKIVFHVDIGRHQKQLIAFCYIIPFLPTAAASMGDVWAPAGVWCWMKNDWRWRFGDWYFFRIASVLIFICLMIHMTVVMRRLRDRGLSTTRSHQIINDDIRTLKVYPIMYIIVNLPPIINRIQNVFTDTDEQGYVFLLLLMQAIVDPSFGAILALVYVLDARTRGSFKYKRIVEAAQRWRQDKSDIKEYPINGVSSSSSV